MCHGHRADWEQAYEDRLAEHEESDEDEAPSFLREEDAEDEVELLTDGGDE
ncbi:hypothetical protein N0B31_19480 [Salinirubellus salinus]|uniref:Uncharacterized protein n=1 Tax=Salinirubellus salinus TaxID=1364945 RepID=A0A9E7U4G4_9EURY|nr:hypothetical protein [Salinirubellus salinus]UWM54285.1 hypothetical protein N0B31_19480 [Salinirubellus salinus]